MKLPIALGLSWPDRLPGVARPCDWSTASSWTFEPLDNEAFPAVELARAGGPAGGTAPAVYNAANEDCVDAFHDGRIGFLGIVDIVTQVLDEHAVSRHPDFFPPRRRLDAGRQRGPDPRGRARRRRLGPLAGLPNSHRRTGSTCARWISSIYIGGAVVFFALVMASIALHEIGHLVPGKIFDVKTTAVLRRVRPDALVSPRRRDRVRVQADPARRLCPLHRHVPTRPQHPGQVQTYSTGAFRALADNARAAEWSDIHPTTRAGCSTRRSPGRS